MPPKTALVAVFLCTGCTMIDYAKAPPADWPELKVDVYRTTFWDTQRLCGGNLLFPTPACAAVDFKGRRCTIITSTDDERVMEHERAHCRGYDHVGETTLADVWGRHER